MPALRQTDWNPIRLAPHARRPETLAPPARCERCNCKMSVYRQVWETRCWQCQDVEPCDPPLAAAGADRLLAAVAGEVREAELDVRLEQTRAAKAARAKRPLSADQQATSEMWARWRSEQGGAVAT